MMPVEIYIAILIACSCILVLTLSFLVAAIYFKVRINEMERRVARIDGGLAELIAESQVFAKKMQQVAARGNGVMHDVGQMAHTFRGWTDRVDRVVDAVATVTEPSMKIASRTFTFGDGILGGVMHVLLNPDKKRSSIRSIDMSENNNGSSAPRILAAFAAGSLIGAGVAMLLAPQSGKKTRDMVSDKAHDLKDSADDVFERGKRFVNDVKHDAQEAFEKGKEIAHENSNA